MLLFESSQGRAGPSLLEKIVIAHVSIYVLMATWMFGGRIYWAYLPLLVWGLLGAALTVVLLSRAKGRLVRHLICLLPLMLLVIQILGSLTNPSFAEFSYYGAWVLRPITHRTWAPSSAYPADGLHDLGLYVGLYLSAYNLFLGVRTRRMLRLFAYIAVSNGALLAVFGTIQKLVGTDMFFGLQKSPNPSFFASFIYHNHWGAYALLSAALALAFAAYHFRRSDSRDLLHSPVLTLSLPTALLVLSIPLSTSRSCTLVALVLCAIALIHIYRTLHRRVKESRRHQFQLNAAVLLGVTLFCGAGYYLAKPVIQQRLRDTIQQVQQKEHYALLKSHQVYYGEARLTLYRDTWRMITDNPVFGWGFGCYGKVFMRYNSQSSIIDRTRAPYLDAHSDWLESLAELGWVGTTWVVGLALGPLWLTRRFILKRAETGYAFLGTLLIAGYATIEFPFANPAVVLTFWCTFFYAIRTAMITDQNQETGRHG